MKKILILLLGSNFILSCDNHEITTQINEPVLADTLFYESKNYIASQGNCANADDCFRISFNYPYFINNNPALNDSLNKLCCFYLIPYPVTARKNCDFKASADEMLKDYAEELEAGILNSSWFYDAVAYIIYQDSIVVSISISREEFMGSAHPNHTEKIVSLLKSNGKSLKLEDVFTDLQEIKNIAELQFRKIHNIKPDTKFSDEGFFMEDGFELTDNFCFQKDGIMFFYNTYEIGPYSMGFTELLIPYESVKSILKDPLQILNNKQSKTLDIVQ